MVLCYNAPFTMGNIIFLEYFFVGALSLFLMSCAGSDGSQDVFTGTVQDTMLGNSVPLSTTPTNNPSGGNNPVLISSSWTLTWGDEFDTISYANWTFETGGGGWGNNEDQYYTNGDNSFTTYDVTIDSNVLVIEAREEGADSYKCHYGDCRYTSSRMISEGKREFQYGRIEARLKLPQTQGIWPAFWMLGNDFRNVGVGWPRCGEIDIMEHVGWEPRKTHGALHGPGYSGATPFIGTHELAHRVDQQYHIYAIEWDANGIQWFVDDVQFYARTREQVDNASNNGWVFEHPFFILLNVAVGGNWPRYPDSTSQFPQRMYVDYVRVYSKR